MDRIIFFASVGIIEASASILSWYLVDWVAPKLFGQLISGWICAGWIVLCFKKKIWSVIPSKPEQLAQTRGAFWTFATFPTMVNRYNPWVAFIIEHLCAFSAVFAAHLACTSLISGERSAVFGHAVTIILYFDRPFELNPPLLPPARTTTLEGTMWKMVGIDLQKAAPKLLAYASTPVKRRRWSRRATKKHIPFPKAFPVDIFRQIVDATLHQIWEETDKMRDPEFSDVLSLMLTCKTFNGWVSPQFYQFVHVANPTRVGQLVRCLELAINDGDPWRQFWETLKEKEQAGAHTDMARAPRIRALSLGDFTWTLNEHLNPFTTLGRVLPHLQRLNIHWSLLHELRKRRIAFYAAQITIVVDAQPPENLADIAVSSPQAEAATDNIGIRYAYPLDASGQVPPLHRRICSFVDPSFVHVSQDTTKKLAKEVYLLDEQDAEQTMRSKSTIPVFLGLGNTFAALGKYTRIVLIVWVGDEEYENWVDPQGDQAFMGVEEGIREYIVDRVKMAGPGRTEGVVFCVPLRKRELSQWSFSVMERNGLDFWEEIEKRIAERAATKENIESRNLGI